ncbi:hypothetical protein ASPVEDRAFT_66554 [Aspergillus versicolor CBS 583.65]|uniref:Zn(2)-C6 fungal-type domain-containing protein n=1 Tax=Aspergillus versicolor CBS 583.65 TaxID=1036611 RepID=A0A1L9Q4F8_ASPVE|nr:uncharacterized protein ASPVEDRAFT_66554 [Aspergillus versicolor CBS 583.65]OJJ08665.1 hypothetical protein ASPVEDRAFT_66554 [Aspergillus versicolor CBS 583.65]
MAQRRSHQKSRHGCLECKRRRVKCDESRPVCANCARRQTECEYDSSGPLRWMTDEPSRSPRPLSDRQQAPPSPDFSLLGQFRSTASANNGDASLPPLNICDLELMLHWVNETHTIFTRSQQTEAIWRTHVPAEALAYPFLMHGILALSALHIACTRSPVILGDTAQRDYLQIAISHQDQALALFREQLGDINSHNGKAMFAFASITVLYAFGFPRTPDPGATAVGDLVQAFVLARGVQQVLSRAMSTIFDDQVWAPIREVNDYEPILPGEAQAAVEQLHKANETCTRQDPILHDSFLYQEAIDHLAELMAAVHAGLGFALACRWVIKLQSAFLDRLRDRRPLALAILAYFCALLPQYQDIWFGTEWARRVVQEIWYTLDDHWRPLIQGCMEEVFGKQYSGIER